jgi:hypothetical protein
MKKLITFDERQDNFIGNYASKEKIPYEEAVRRLIFKKKGIKVDIEPKEASNGNELSDIKKQLKEIREKVEAIGWYSLDDMESKLSQLTYKLNILTKVSKLFKEHINNNEIHGEKINNNDG